jgi:hypothetical protein
MDCGARRPRDAMRALRCYCVCCQLGGAHQLFSYPAYSCSSLPLMCIFSHTRPRSRAFLVSCFLGLVFFLVSCFLALLLSWSRAFLVSCFSWSRAFLVSCFSWSPAFLVPCFSFSWSPAFLVPCFSWSLVFLGLLHFWSLVFLCLVLSSSRASSSRAFFVSCFS